MIEEQQPHWSPRLIGIRALVEKIGKGLKPDSDWMPVIFVEGTFPPGMPGIPKESIGKTGTLVVGAPDAMCNPESKEKLAQLMVMLAVTHKAVGMTFVSTVWLSILDAKPIPGESEADERKRFEEEARLHGQPSEDPNRRECLMLISVYFGGEDDGTKFIMADIKRGGPHPKLTNWTIREPDGFLGRFPEAIYAGLKLASMMREGE